MCEDCFDGQTAVSEVIETALYAFDTICYNQLSIVQVKSIQRTRNTATRASQAGRAAPGAAAVARAEAVAAAALAAGEAPAVKVEPLLSLARALVRHAKARKNGREEGRNR